MRRLREPLAGGWAAVRRSRLAWWALALFVGLAGAQLAVAVAGSTVAQVGPVEVRLSLTPSLRGDTLVELPPLGSLALDTHDGPFRVQAQVLAIDETQARALVSDPTRLEGLEKRVAEDARRAVVQVGARSALAALVGAVVATSLVLHRPRAAALGAVVAIAGLVVGVGSAAATWKPESITQPRFEGLLALAPTVVGDARDIVHNFDRYRQQLAQIVTNVSQLYVAGSTLPTFSPDEDTVRVLFVSDVHLNPAAFDVMRAVSEEFATHFVIDAGDLTDRGSAPEERFAALIPTLDQPYVFVRGNHDSLGTQRAVEAQPNAVVLRDGESVEIEGLRIVGAGDPRFTPDKNTRDDELAASVEQASQDLLERVRAEAEEGVLPDIVLVHDPAMGEPLDGLAPLILAGHGHRREIRPLDAGTRVFEQGTTGGAGLRGLEGEEPMPVQLSVLYFDRTTGALQAWDDITLGGLGLTSAEIDRHVADEQVEARRGQEAEGEPGSELPPSDLPAQPVPGPGLPTQPARVPDLSTEADADAAAAASPGVP